jgi:hypothetical protein
MTYKCLGILSALALLSDIAHAGSAPKELYGKSIIITWTEQRSQRQLGQVNFRDILDPLSNRIYISTAGRWFGRFASTFRGYEGAHEAVGTGGTSAGGGPRQVEFSGRTITTTGTSKGGLARRITIEFNESFTTCEARVTVAKQAGSEVVMGRNLYTGQSQEIRSATVSGRPSCSIREGNVFGQ